MLPNTPPTAHRSKSKLLNRDLTKMQCHQAQNLLYYENGKIERVVSSENDPAIIYDSEGGVYPADIMALAVLLNSD